ncbi:MAG: hypothetical protein ABR566_10545 [Pyrinomonadaceae bacterium]
MCQSTLARYWFIDDLLNSRGRQEDVRAKVSDSDVICDALFRRQL